jgi:hypothetical protein
MVIKEIERLRPLPELVTMSVIVYCKTEALHIFT